MGKNVIVRFVLLTSIKCISHLDLGYFEKHDFVVRKSIVVVLYGDLPTRKVLLVPIIKDLRGKMLRMKSKKLNASSYEGSYDGKYYVYNVYVSVRVCVYISMCII